ncbi:MAG: DUF5686 family protein, partial [Marinirhabdus sp.]
KYGLSAKYLLDHRSRFTVFAGTRKDVEQTGASLTTSNDVLGRSLASSSLISVGNNDRLTRIKLATAGFSIEPWKNFNIRLTGTYRTLQSATATFSLDYFDEQGNVQSQVKQPEFELGLFYTPHKKTTGYGVERTIINGGSFPSFFIGYTYGTKAILNGDFNYSKLQALYTQPFNIGGLGRLHSTVEAGTILNPVPLGLLSPVPGNQTYFSLYNAFTNLDYYEFVSDTYASLHLQHDFGGRIFSRIPLLKNLDLREVVGFRAVYGEISDKSKAINASNIVYQAPEEVYYEYSVGVGNIFRVFRLDFNFRGNYLHNPNARKFGVTGIFGFSF